MSSGDIDKDVVPDDIEWKEEIQRPRDSPEADFVRGNHHIVTEIVYDDTNDND